MKRAAALVLACVGAGVLAACNKATIQPGDARLSFDGARVQVASPGQPLRTVGTSTRLGTGDRVKVIGGEARLVLADGAELLLRDGSEVVVDRQPALRAGEVVATVDDEPLTVQSSGSRVAVLSGVSRIRTGLALTTGVYSGAAQLTSAGRSLRVPAYRQAAVVAFGALPATPAPLEYRATDAWDRRYLGEAIEIGEELQRRSDGFSNQLRPNEGHTPGFFSILLPELPANAFDRCTAALAGGRRPGEVLVGTSLALRGRGSSFAARCGDAFAFRDAGATWGLVALDQGARSLPAIREDLVAAIGRLPSSATIALGPAAPDVATPLDGRTPDVVAPVAATPAAPRPTPTAPATPAPAPVPSSPAAPVPPVLPPLLPPPPDSEDGLLSPVGDLVDNLLSGLLG